MKYFLILLFSALAFGGGVTVDYVRLSPSTLPSTCNNGDLRVGPTPTFLLEICRANTWYSFVDASSFTNPMTTNGDMIYQATGVATRLAIGTSNYVMISSGTAPSWGLLANANIDPAAAIAYSKLNLGTSIVDADVSASAAITRSKTASGTAYRILANSSSGVMSENAALTASRACVSDANGQLASSSVATATLAFLDATSSVQTQIDTKAPSASPTFSGTITTPLATSRAVATGASSQLVASSTTATELGYVNGVTSAIQTQINTKAPSASPTFSGTITTPLTSSRALATGASGELAVSATTSTELGYVNGVTSAIQTQFSNKLSLSGGTMSGALNMGTNLINAVVDPSSAQDAATKNYVDTQLSYLNPADAVYAASIANIPGTYTNLVSGVCLGDTFTITATGALSLDGTSPTSGMRVLLKDQTNSFQDGVWTVTVVGSVGVSPILTRALDYTTSSDFNSGQIVPIINGTVNAGASYFQTATNSTCSSSTQTWTQFQKAASAYMLAGTPNQYGVLLSGASTTPVVLAPDSSTTKVLKSGGASANPSWLAYTDAATASTLMSRDSSGNTAFVTATGALTGTASGNTTYTANNHGVVVSGSANAMTVIAPDSSASKLLKSGGASADPSWLAYTDAATASTVMSRDSSGNTAFVTATGALTGTASGNTTISSQTNHGVVVASSTNAMGSTTAGTSGQVLTSNGSSSDPTFQAANFSWTFTSQTGTYTAVAGDFVLASTNSFTVTMPAASSNTGKTIAVQKTDSDVTKIITISPNLQGASRALYSQYETVILVSDGTNWQLLSHTYPEGSISWVATGSLSTNTTYTGNYSRSGNIGHFRQKITFGAGNTQGVVTINQPTGIAIDTSLILDTTNDYVDMHSHCTIADVSVSDYLGSITYNSSTVVTVRYSADDAGGGTALNTGQVSTATPIPWTAAVAIGDFILCEWDVPITGWW